MEDYAIVEMTAITDKTVVKDGLRLIVSKEFQQKHVDDFVGKPLMSDHSSERSEKLGRIYSAQLVTSDDTTSVKVKAFIPKLADNQNDIERIRLGQDREVSLGFRFSKYEEIERNGVPHIKVVPSDNQTDGIQEVSLVGVPACPGCGVTSIAASADDKPLDAILTDKYLSKDDRECLLFGRMNKGCLIDDVVSYERQLGLVTDMKLAADTYRKLSPFNLQDRRLALLNTLKKNEKRDTQTSVDVEALLAAETWEDEPPKSHADIRQEAINIAQTIRS